MCVNTKTDFLLEINSSVPISLPLTSIYRLDFNSDFIFFLGGGEATVQKAHLGFFLRRGEGKCYGT